MESYLIKNQDYWRYWFDHEDPNISDEYDLDHLYYLRMVTLQEKKEIQESNKLWLVENETHATREEAKKFVKIYKPPKWCAFRRMDVRNINWKTLHNDIGSMDAIILDPPWKIASHRSMRGLHLGFKTLTDQDIFKMNLSCLSKEGFIFLWTINSKYMLSIKLLEKWGYRYHNTISWAKLSNRNHKFKSNGYALQHSQELCLIGIKGNPVIHKKASISIQEERKGQSKKPIALYSLIEGMLPQGKFLEIFARRNNLRNFWVSIGLEFEDDKTKY
ncbi:mt-a70 family protein [Anaeramoeba flamelloides]|uniref:mRNA m(6)A methyltransferase n=1 Tax=Anaeramoeba flamelloides TaxID=1746091 RepID=A0ABQ8Z023_9EUKA|nr:mt-a70 family protein [Anaeramoeba flamelloides]